MRKRHSPIAEAIGEQKKGMRTSPFPLSSGSSPFTLTNPMLNIAFRIDAGKSNKLTVRDDDLRHSVTNMAYFSRTPIKLAMWGRLAEVSRA